MYVHIYIYTYIHTWTYDIPSGSRPGKRLHNYEITMDVFIISSKSSTDGSRLHPEVLFCYGKFTGKCNAGWWLNEPL